MMGRKRLRPSYASATATLALVLAVGMSGAYAADKIGSKQIAANAVKSKHIKNGQVRTPDLAADVEVDSAKRADAATTADTATTADSAKSADTAKTADTAKSADTANAVAPNSVSGAGVADGTLGGADLANEAVTGGKIANGTIGFDDLADESVNGAEIVDQGVNSDDLGAFSVGANHLKPNSVGASALKGATTATSQGTAVSAGGVGNAQVTCPGNLRVIGGGFSWQDDEPNSIIYSAPSNGDPHRTWIVRGLVPAGSNVLYAWANCLQF